MSVTDTELKNQDWPRIIKETTLYAHSRLKFWGLIGSKRLKGNTAKDIAVTAIEAVITGRWNWDSKLSDLSFYLKFHVVKGMVANLAKDLETRSSAALDISLLEKESDYSQENELNSAQIMDQIRSDFSGDNLLTRIVDLLSQGLKRAEVCDELNISLKVYNNAFKRIRTRILKLEKTGIFNK
jgi:hypothetical protein